MFSRIGELLMRAQRYGTGVPAIVMDNDDYPRVATLKVVSDSPIQAHRFGAELFVDQLEH
jgi:hypothetical protein